MKTRSEWVTWATIALGFILVGLVAYFLYSTKVSNQSAEQDYQTCATYCDEVGGMMMEMRKREGSPVTCSCYFFGDEH